MKRISTVLLLCLLLSGSLKGQFQKAGLFTGLNMAYMESDPVLTHTQQFSFSAVTGGLINKKLNRHYTVQAEISYVCMGEKINGMQKMAPAVALAEGLALNTCGYIYANNRINLHYLQIPLLLKGTVPVNSLITYYALLGPAVAYLINANSAIDSESILYNDQDGKQPVISSETGKPVIITIDRKVLLNDQFHRFNLSGIGAIGLEVHKKNHGFFLESRMTMGLVNIYRNPELQGEGRTESVALNAGYIFYF